MFTGIVEELGQVASIKQRSAGARLTIACHTVLADAFEGSSIAVNGVCLTALDVTDRSFSADVAPETLLRTNLGELRENSLVNLERPLAATSRLSGHIVQGHVDGTGEFLSLELLGDNNWWLRIRIPGNLDPYVIYKGSIAIDGVSLTVAAVEQRIVSATIIPHTYAMTSLREHKPGEKVNLECDVLAKYVEKMLAGTLSQSQERNTTMSAESNKYSPVSAYLMVDDGNSALDWYKRAFHAEVTETYPHEGKLGHATLSINGSDVMLSDEFPEALTGVKSPKSLGGTTCSIALSVDDADTWFERARAAGAEVIRPLKDEFYGRSGKIRDPFGHVWGIVGPLKKSH